MENFEQLTIPFGYGKIKKTKCDYHNTEFHPIIKKEKKITIKDSVNIALSRLPKIFYAYSNPYQNSLVSEVRKISERPFVSDGTIMRTLRDVPNIQCIDHCKSIYEQLL